MTPVATLGVAHTLIAAGGRPVTLVTETGAVFNGTPETEASTLFAAMSTAPTLSRQYAINALIAALKSAGIWTKLDVLQVFAAADAQAASLNWKNPATFTASPQSSPTFTADRGYNGDGAASYVNTTWAPSNGVNYTQDSATIFAWSRTSAAESDDAKGILGSGTTTAVRLTTRSSANLLRYRINQASSSSGGSGITDGSGLYAASRSGAAATQAYRNGATSGLAGSVASGALSSVTLNIGRLNTTAFSSAQCAAWGAGSNLSAAEHLSLYNALRAYLIAVGAA